MDPSVTDVTVLKEFAAVRISALEMGGSAGSSEMEVDHSCGLPSQSSCRELRSWRSTLFGSEDHDPFASLATCWTHPTVSFVQQ